MGNAREDGSVGIVLEKIVVRSLQGTTGNTREGRERGEHIDEASIATELDARVSMAVGTRSGV